MIKEHINLDPTKIVLDELLPGGARWSKTIKRGQKIRISTEDGMGSLSAMFYNADNTSERFNSADTVKLQHNAYFCKGRVFYSEQGRVLFSITEDTTGGLFDAIAGISNPRTVKKSFGEGDFEHLRYRRPVSFENTAAVVVEKCPGCLMLHGRLLLACGESLSVASRRPSTHRPCEACALPRIFLERAMGGFDAEGFATLLTRISHS